MVQRGHSDKTIRKILGENVLRVWRDNTPAKSWRERSNPLIREACRCTRERWPY
jgi:hypothetical protein